MKNLLIGLMMGAGLVFFRADILDYWARTNLTEKFQLPADFTQADLQGKLKQLKASAIDLQDKLKEASDKSQDKYTEMKDALYKAKKAVEDFETAVENLKTSGSELKEVVTE